MAHLKYSSYKGIGVEYLQQHGYSQAVKVGDLIDCSGQGGWDTDTGLISTDLDTEIFQAFKNVELNLKDAGGSGWSQVYKVRSYHVGLGDEAHAAMTKYFKKFMPDHAPIWTVLSVPALGRKDMRVEIDVTAHTG